MGPCARKRWMRRNRFNRATIPLACTTRAHDIAPDAAQSSSANRSRSAVFNTLP